MWRHRKSAALTAFPASDHGLSNETTAGCIIRATITSPPGDYEAVRMRTMAEITEVALGAFHRCSPSEPTCSSPALPTSSSASRRNRPQLRSRRHPAQPDSVLERTTGGPDLTETMTRAFMFADITAAAAVETVGHPTERMLTKALSA